MKHFLIALNCLLLSICSGCASNEQNEIIPNASLHVLLIDLSKGDEALDVRRSTYSQNASKIVEALQTGDRIIVAPINESSLSSSLLIADHKFGIFAPTTDNPMYIKKQKKNFDLLFQQAKDSLVAIIDVELKMLPESQSTDVFGGVHFAYAALSSNDFTSKNLVLISDMEEYSSNYKFNTGQFDENRNAAIIDKEKKSARGIPNLSKVNIYVFGADSRDNNRLYEIRNFWIAYFESSGANLEIKNYGSRVLEYP